MAIVNSSFAVGVPQHDGRVWVTETHVDSTGQEHQFMYLAAPDHDHAAVMAARAVALAEQLAQAEIDGVLNGD